jgi:hypothetical protein
VAIEFSPFEVAGDILVGLVPDDMGEVRQQARRYGIKVWFGGNSAPREHYEAQIVSAKDAPGATALAVEVGFHAEHPKEADNERVVASLVASEKRWRNELGKEVEAGPFLGRAAHWRRISETWLDPDLGDADLPFEIAVRLTDYITALEPLRRT